MVLAKERALLLFLVSGSRVCLVFVHAWIDPGESEHLMRGEKGTGGRPPEQQGPQWTSGQLASEAEQMARAW